MSGNDQLVSIIILNYNAKPFLAECLNSIEKSSYKNIEIIFVDNASTDDSISFIKKNYLNLNLKIVKNEKNYGFNEGNNIGFIHSKGDYCLFMNPDVKINDLFTIEKMVQILFAEEDVGIISPVLLNFNSDIVQSAGVYLSSRSFEYGKGERYSSFLRKNPTIFTVAVTPGAFVMIRRKLIEKIGLFDKLFFMQGDIDDLSLRAWKKGYRVLMLPTVTVMHYEGGSVKQYYKKDYERLLRGYYHGIRADLAVITKNFDSNNVIKFITLRLFIYFIETFFFSIKYKNAYPLFAYVKSLYWDIKNFRNIYSSRKRLQRSGVRKDSLFMSCISSNSNIFDYFRRMKTFRS